MEERLARLRRARAGCDRILSGRPEQRIADRLVALAAAAGRARQRLRRGSIPICAPNWSRCNGVPERRSPKPRSPSPTA